MLAPSKQIQRSNVVRVFFLYPDFRARVFVDKGLVFAVLRSKRKILDAYSEPETLAASAQMRFKLSGNQLVLYEPKSRA